MSRRHAPIAALAGAVLALALAAPAQASYDPLGSGTTKLRLDRGFLALARANGVRLSAMAPATLKGATVSFPVIAGKFDPTTAKGTVEHDGALLFQAGGRSIPLKDLQLKTTQRRSPLSAKLGGGQLKLASAAALSVSRWGFADKVKVSALALSAKVATRLDKKLRLKGVFGAGQPLGATQTLAAPKTVALQAKGKLTIAPDPGFLAKLGSLFVAANPIFPAEHLGADFELPIFGGQVAPDGSEGSLETSGSLELLQLGAGQVFWAEPFLDLAAHTFTVNLEVEPSPPYGGKLGATAVASLGTGAFSADPKTRALDLSGAQLTLGDASAQGFEEVFAKPQGQSGVFHGGEAVGSVAFSAQGQ